jgi:hypothetical protein
LRGQVTLPDFPKPDAEQIAAALFRLTAHTPGPSLGRFLAKSASLEQAREFLIHRSIYTLREAGPDSRAIRRLTGRPKVALVEVQSDEYGAGRPERMHAEIFARTMRAVGSDATYGAYLDAVPAGVLASQNAMPMFGINRRLLGAIVGHLAAFEMTSSLPNRMYGDAFRRLGIRTGCHRVLRRTRRSRRRARADRSPRSRRSAGRGSPDLLPDIFFGAAACLFVDDRAAGGIRNAFRGGADIRTHPCQPSMTGHSPVRIAACSDGPLLIRGDVEIVGDDCYVATNPRRTVALCRCGASAIKPWCDGTHKLARSAAAG